MDNFRCTVPLSFPPPHLFSPPLPVEGIDPTAPTVGAKCDQDKDQKAQISYEDNMGVQGFGNTFASGFGMS